VRIVLCDDHRLFAEPVAAALAHRGHEVVVVASVAAALETIDAHRPDLCLMDLRLPDGDGVEAVASLRARHPECPVVVVSGSLDAHDLSRALSAGAAGFVRKAQPLSALFEAVDRIAAGAQLEHPPSLRSQTSSDERGRVRELLSGLTEREREVLRRLVDAEDTVAIARSLGVAPSTARSHLQNVLQKLGVHGRMQAVALVVAAGMEDLSERPPP
jgi:two-component system, NarL family, nitrate/nitrite response regulator NarL